MTTVKTKRIQPGYEPIEGYILEKRIGQGGFGEVWRAVAPGGLKKAVKFVFGQHDERRAAQELKSLERIKGVQHPFILTLERFELIDNQLVIVTELADGSLEDVYKKQQERGSCGIPREALLGYMKDAADALDYLHQLYKLQHLDIKPANLLIVGGRVKVADFGLLKDLGEIECSIVGGLTPIYAPPEVFDGRPSIHSDQYSLAVMYQELLTSTRPFSGRTIAQLATQHVHNAPNLKPLPAVDRPCVARALEKNPNQRYQSCSEFVQKLANPHGRRANDPETAIETPSKDYPVENLPQLCDRPDAAADVNQTQVLVIGLGGTGADCLNQLRFRIAELGANSPITMHSVLIDTDPVTTQTMTMFDPTNWLPRSHVIEAPLRSPNDYRDAGTARLKSISRRWIYNVPRNRNTGGMRPLGRLALVDHGKKVIQTLRGAVEELKSTLPKGGHPKIYVVGSLTGGTGSGIYIDVVYLLRHLLDDLEMENESILSFLTTNRFQGDPARPLALHATKSAISELAHFLKPGNNYPGDEGAGWPSVPAARTPLHDAYIIAQSNYSDAPDSLDSVVDYLWADASVCGDWFASGRGEQGDALINPISIRSMSVVPIGAPGERQSNILAPQTAKSLLLRWLGNPRDAKKDAIDFANRINRRCYLTPDAMRFQAERWFGSTEQERRGRLMEHLKTMDPAVLNNKPAIQSHLVKWLTTTINLDQTEVISGQIRQQIDREITLRLQDGRINLSSVIEGLSEIQTHAQRLHQDLIQESDHLTQQLSAPDTDPDDQTGDTDSPQGPLGTLRNAADIGERLVGLIACRAAASVATSVEEKLTDMTELFSDASARIAQSIQKLSGDQGIGEDRWSTVDQSLRQQSSQIIKHLHERCCASHLYKVIQSPNAVAVDAFVNELTASAAAHIRDVIGAMTMSDDSQSSVSASTARLVVEDTSIDKTNSLVNEKTTSLSVSFDSLATAQTHVWSGQESTPALTVQAAIDAVRPPLLECGGKQRLYLICRDKCEQEKFESELADSKDSTLTTILARSSMPMLVHEAQGIELKNVLSWLDALTGDNGKISDRLATRCDIDWA